MVVVVHKQTGFLKWIVNIAKPADSLRMFYSSEMDYLVPQTIDGTIYPSKVWSMTKETITYPEQHNNNIPSVILQVGSGQGGV